MNLNESIDAASGGREALNRAFWELGLRFEWDEATWAILLELPDLPAQLAYYLEHWQPHLLAAYNPEFLAGLVRARLATPGSGPTGMEAFSSF